MALAPTATDVQDYRAQVLACAADAPDPVGCARAYAADLRLRLRDIKLTHGTECEAFEVAVRQLTGAVLAYRDVAGAR